MIGGGVLLVVSRSYSGPACSARLAWRRVRVLGWVGLVVVVSSLAIGCGAAQPRARTGANGVVPWVDHPAPPDKGPAPVKVTADARPCRPRDLGVTPGQAGVGLGHTNVQVLFENRSASACLLAGYPTVAGIGAGGVVTPLAASHGSYFGNPGPTANIAPGQTAAVNVSGADACQAAQGGQHVLYRELRIGLPRGGVIDARVRFDAVCGASVSRFGVPAGLPKVPRPSPLTARITAAATARPGEDFWYKVTLTNPTASAFVLRPCPAYEEYVFPIPPRRQTLRPGQFVVRNCHLNCADAGEIGAHSSVTFQMRLQLPAGLPVGWPAKFVWLMHGGGPGASAPLRITR